MGKRTYELVGPSRTADGWFAYAVRRLPDRKFLLIPKARYRQLQRDGRIVLPAPSEADNG